MDLQNPNSIDEVPESSGSESGDVENMAAVTPSNSDLVAETTSSAPADSEPEAEDAAPQVETAANESETAEGAESEPEAARAEASESVPMGEDMPHEGDAAYDDDDIEGAAQNQEEDEDEDDTDQEEGARIKRGILLEGIIVETTPTEITMDLGEGVTGIIPSRELEYLDSKILLDLEVGSKHLVYVLSSGKRDGQPRLSISRALEEQDWREAESYADSRKTYKGHIAGYNKGGLIVRFGRLRGFIPASQISQEREQRGSGSDPDQRWSEMLNEPIMVKVVEVNRSRNRLILSERAAAREYREEQKERLIHELSVGDIRTGRVISLTDFGAFVDLGGADGLIHLTEMSWKHVGHPRELLNIGDEVQVKVINIDPDRKRIGLSMKSMEEDPWDEVARTYQEDQLVQGKITKLTRFGAFASLMDNVEVEGLIHVSELADYRVEHPRDVVAVGDVLTLRVIKIDDKRRRLGLSLKRVNSPEYMNSDWDSWGPSE